VTSSIHRWEQLNIVLTDSATLHKVEQEILSIDAVRELECSLSDDLAELNKQRQGIESTPIP